MRGGEEPDGYITFCRTAGGRCAQNFEAPDVAIRIHVLEEGIVEGVGEDFLAQFER